MCETVKPEHCIVYYLHDEMIWNFVESSVLTVAHTLSLMLFISGMCSLRQVRFSMIPAVSIGIVMCANCPSPRTCHTLNPLPSKVLINCLRIDIYVFDGETMCLYFLNAAAS